MSEEKPNDTPAEEAGEADETGLEEAQEPSAANKLKEKLDPVLRHAKLIAVGFVLLLLSAIFAWIYFSTGYFSQARKAFTPSPTANLELPGNPVFQDLQNMVVDLKPTKRRKRPFIRFTLTVEFVGEPTREILLERETKIRDAIQVHLRTVTVEELSGEGGTNKLRKDMIGLINSVIAPDRITTVLFKDIIVR